MSTVSDPHPGPGAPSTSGGPGASASNPLTLVLSWLVVGVPLVYGVWQTLVKAAKLFTG